MSAVSEFHYRLRAPATSYRPGPHPSSTLGTGQDFAAYARLMDSADPRRLDIRASLRNVRREWLVKVYRQRASVPVYAVVDVSSSMQFGSPSKLHRVAEFAESLGYSAFRSGDPAGLLAFDAEERADLYIPARHNRGVGVAMASQIRGAGSRRGLHGGAGLFGAVKPLAGKRALVFIVSDFHWPLADLTMALDVLAQASVVPVVVWDMAETHPPEVDGLLAVGDAESGVRRALWVGRAVRETWNVRVDARRRDIQTAFAQRDIRPFFMQGAFEPESLSQYFLEEVT